MCGFVGTLSFRSFRTIRPEQPLSEMAFARRGTEPPCTHEAEGLWLAHALLPVRPPGVRQPFVTDSGRYVLVYNGEDYGPAAQNVSDTRLIGERLDRIGPERTYGELDGEFALAVYDSQAETLYLGRDPIGVKPLFWARHARGFVFGSCAADVAAMVRAHVSPERVAEYLALLRTEAGTGWEGVDALPPRAVFRIGRDGSVERLRASSSGPRPDALARSDLGSRFRSVFRGVMRSMEYAGPRAVLLSGGLDSSAVFHELAESSRDGLLAVTYASGDASAKDADDRSVDETAIASRLAAQRDVPHDVVPALTGTQFLEILVRSTRSMGFPAGNCWVENFACYERLRKRRVKVAFVGDGADDLFGGYPWRYRGALSEDAPPASYQHIEIEQVIPANLAAHCREVEARQWQESLGDSRTLSDAAIRFARHRLLPNWVHQTDAVAGHYAVEVRVPFLHREVLALSERASHDQLVVDGVGKVPLRDAYATSLGQQIAWGPKLGFVAAETTLYRRVLAPLFRHLLRDSPVWDLGIGLRAGFERLVGEHLDGRRDHRKSLWALLAIDAWLRLLVREETEADVLGTYVNEVTAPAA